VVENKVCAVVVTYRPHADDFDNLAYVRPQVEKLVVVDNGSDEEALTRLRYESQGLNFGLVENGRNLGIAAALNTGVRWARSHGCNWVLLLDQDSAIAEGFVEAMLRGFEGSAIRDRLALLVPRYIDRRSNRVLEGFTDKKGMLLGATTSGSFMPISTVSRLGMFNESFFIGAVDFEYFLRLTKAGYVVEECKSATLLHAPSSPRVHTVFGIYLFRTSNYSAVRRYYEERNRMWLRLRYWKDYHKFFWKRDIGNIKVWITIRLGESDRCRKFAYIWKGNVDGLIGRMGRKADRM
jgi:rhamnosyltransferase